MKEGSVGGRGEGGEERRGFGGMMEEDEEKAQYREKTARLYTVLHTCRRKAEHWRSAGKS